MRFFLAGGLRKKIPFLCSSVTGLLCVIVFLTLFSDSGLTAESTEILKSKALRYYYGLGVPKNLNHAFRLYRKAAEQGDADAMFIVGGLYMKGQGTEVNRTEAFKWLYDAAIHGRSSKESQKILGEFFLTGQGVPRNYSEAMQWYELAAQNGDVEAQNELAYHYFIGKRVERDYEKAYYWFKRAAEKGYPLGQYNIGILWYTGNGVSGIDPVQAYAWFSLAAANGHGDGEIAKNFLETRLNKDELRQAQELSVRLYREIETMKLTP
ncbi:MAG: sel1 repeat family protein [Proteobacteria bacterium]|nr:sel1 repeat family protein [Pseudomonadota bacterium]MBU1059519.1 sel1 repeat family protein [Pseudomonadota bacterium]